jgi:hypothetical protein
MSAHLDDIGSLLAKIPDCSRSINNEEERKRNEKGRNASFLLFALFSYDMIFRAMVPPTPIPKNEGMRFSSLT